MLSPAYKFVWAHAQPLTFRTSIPSALDDRVSVSEELQFLHWMLHSEVACILDGGVRYSTLGTFASTVPTLYSL